MLQDSIRLIAAAFCGERKKIELSVTPEQALRPAMEYLLRVSAYVQISASGVAEVDPIARLPMSIQLRFFSLPKEDFLLFAGIAAKLNEIFRVQTVEGGIERSELQTLSDAMCGVLVFSMSDGVILSSFSTYDSLDPAVAVSPAFAAGALLGTVLGYSSTRFRLGENRNAPEVICAINAINEFGGTAIENEDGTVTVRTVRFKRFNPKTGKRLRKRAK